MKQVDPVTVFAPSNAAFAQANADGWVGNLASLRHLLLRHLVRWEWLISLSTIELTKAKENTDSLVENLAI